MKTLVINTYAGSLLLGARSAKCDVIGSYEDVGYGSDIQRANWPDIEIIDKTEDWPTQDLSDVTVIAHPPCSAFSLMNASPAARGPDSKAFSCTKNVLKYAMENKAKVVAIESVCGALEGARHIHDTFAKEYGYQIFRVLQNGLMFNSPQYRERFWVIYVKDGPQTFHFDLEPRYTRVGEIVEGFEGTETVPGLEEKLIELKHKMGYHLKPEQVDEVFGPNPRFFGPYVKVIHKSFFPDDDYVCLQWDIHGEYGGGQLEILPPKGHSPVLLGSSWWFLNGRNLSVEGYKRIMGFPHDYVFPELKRNYLKQVRTFLSKGVIPNVAAWILASIRRHLGDENTTYGRQVTIASGETADFRIKKMAWKKMWENVAPHGGQPIGPEIRHYW
jgi:site-specific DNA-cytosine methylase